MKLVFFLIGVLFTVITYSQNSLPIVSVSQLDVDTSNKSVSITYDVSDADNDTLEVYLKISGDSGLSFTVPVDSVVGDIGKNIIPGTSKMITWYYADSISNYLTSGVLQKNNMYASVVVSDNHPVDIDSLVNRVDSNLMYNDLLWMEGRRNRNTGNSHLQTTRDSIYNRLNRFGYQTRKREYAYNGDIGVNITGRKPGSTRERKTLLITGHYDTVENSGGADDNATAVAGFMEIARILADYDSKYSIKYIGFDMEEDGLIGSVNYLNGQSPIYEDIIGVLNFEMIGYYTEQPYTQEIPLGFDVYFSSQYQELVADSFRGNFITNVGNGSSIVLQDLFDSCAAAYVPELKVQTIYVPGSGLLFPDLNRSDHAPFWWAGYPALMLSDGSEYRNNNYHTMYDKVSTLNMGFMKKVVQATLATAAHYAKIYESTSDTSELFNLNMSALNGVEINRQDKEQALKVYPSPFSDELTIEYEIDKCDEVEIQILDVGGKLVFSAYFKQQQAGVNKFRWSGKDNSGRNIVQGIYYARLITAKTTLTEQFIHIKPHAH